MAKLPDRRFSLAVIGHELIEALYCKLRGITTEQCDAFDDWMETQYKLGAISVTFEGGFHKNCPYRVGHIMGAIWENIVIYGTFASMDKYEAACNKVMGIIP